MPGRKSPTFTEVELEFMQIIWASGEVSTEDVQTTLRKRGRELSDGSIRKILSILMTKGHLSRRRSGKSFYYRAKVHKEQAAGTMIQDLLKRAFNGSVPSMVATLLKSRDMSTDDFDAIKRLIAEHEKEENS